jgi:hypothetical protein
MPSFGYGGSYQPQASMPIQGNPGSRAAFQALQMSTLNNNRQYGIDQNKQNENLQVNPGGFSGQTLYGQLMSSAQVSDPNSPYADNSIGGTSAWQQAVMPKRAVSSHNNEWTYAQEQSPMLQPGYNPLKKWDETMANQQQALASGNLGGLAQLKSGPALYSMENAIGDYQRYLTAYNELQKRGVSPSMFGRVNGYDQSQYWTPETKNKLQQNWQQFTSAMAPRFVQQGNLTFQSGRQL